MGCEIEQYNPDVDIPDLSGKVIFVTGGTAGLGAATITALAKHAPSHIFFSGRNESRATSIISSLKSSTTTTRFTFLKMDLASLSSVKTAAQEFLSLSKRLDILICNAGIMAVPPGLTTDGYEIQFGTNHLGHAMLIKQLLPTLLATASQPSSDVRIVSLTSLGFRGAPAGIAYPALRTPQYSIIGGSWIRYGQSKLANILYISALSRKYPSIKSVVVHPGVIATDLVNNLSWGRKAFVWVAQFGRFLTEEQGAFNSLWAATSKDAESGGFYVPVGKKGMHSKLSDSEENARELWEWTEGELAKF